MPRHVEQYVSPNAEVAEEEAANAEVRARVRQDAIADRPVRIHPDDVRAAFEGHEEERDEIRQLRDQARARRAAAASSHDEAERLKRETDAVLAEWDADRHRKAEAEARKRLAIPAPKTT